MRYLKKAVLCERCGIETYAVTLDWCGRCYQQYAAALEKEKFKEKFGERYRVS